MLLEMKKKKKKVFVMEQEVLNPCTSKVPCLILSSGYFLCGAFPGLPMSLWVFYVSCFPPTSKKQTNRSIAYPRCVPVFGRETKSR